MGGLVVDLDVPFLDQQPAQACQAHGRLYYSLQLPPASAPAAARRSPWAISATVIS